jgi:hypothetical protein
MKNQSISAFKAVYSILDSTDIVKTLKNHRDIENTKNY